MLRVCWVGSHKAVRVLPLKPGVGAENVLIPLRVVVLECFFPARVAEGWSRVGCVFVLIRGAWDYGGEVVWMSLTV